MSFMRLKYLYHDKGIRNLCKWNFWTFHIEKDREDCVTWSHFFKKKLLIFQLVCWDFIRTCEVSIDLRATNTEIMNGPATHWPIYFPGNAYYVFSSNLTCHNQLWDKVREQESRADGRQRTIKIYPRLCTMISQEPEVVSGWMEERFKRQNFAFKLLIIVISVSITIYKIFLIWTEFESI